MRKIRLFYIFLPMLLVAFSLSSCHYVNHKEVRASKADSLIFSAGAVLDYDRMRLLTDSFEMTGDISALDANRWRGVVYYRQGQYHLAEMCYRKALESDVKTNEDQLSYNKVTRRLSELLLIKGDFEGSLRIAIPAVAKMEKSGIGSDIDYAILLNNIGICQLHLGRDEEANESFITAREHYVNRWKTDSTSRGFQEAVIGTVYTSQAYINTRRYSESIYWIDRTEMLLNMYRQRPDARSAYFDEYQGRIEIMRAIALEGLHKSREAADAYKRFQKTAYSQTAAGHINANEYLVVAHRYQEAANNYRYLDKALSDWGTEMTLDNMQLYMLPKYRANAEAGRHDSAVVIGQRILSLLDSAITTQKNSATAELATIYDTQGKEAEIARKEADLSKTRLVSTGIALVLLIVFFLIYTLHKRKSAHRLAAAHNKLEDAHAKLQTAYDQLEKTTKAKERIESELRIARDIQMSMVPRTFPAFPDRRDIDLHAAIVPAKEVGGDLYDFFLQDDRLCFCVGDVSGKGIPASLTMAVAVNLFRTVAKEGFPPEVIATKLNDTMSANNENAVFVTMFIGIIDLKTGNLDYCNCGHNSPVYGERRMLTTQTVFRFLDVESNVPIGLWPDYTFVGGHLGNIRGSSLFVYTDGVNEAENRMQEQFGEKRMLRVLRESTQPFGERTPKTRSHVLIDEMKYALDAFVDGAEQSDDLTMLCVSIK